MVDEQAVAARGGDGGGGGVEIGLFEKLAIKAEGLPPFSGELGGLRSEEKEFRRFRRVVGEPWLDGGEGEGGAVFRQAELEDLGNGGFVLGGGGFEGGDAVVQGGGVGEEGESKGG